MKHNVQTPSYREYGDDRIETKPRLELVPFLGQRRLFVANFLYSRKIRDLNTGRYYRNGKFGNIYDLVSGTPIALPGRTNSDHMWIEGKHWPSDQWAITDIPNMQKVSFTAKVDEYTTPEKNYIDYRAIEVSDLLDWDRYDRNMDILADYDAGCPDIPHYSPEFSTFVPGSGCGQNPNSDDSEIPMSH